MSQGIANTQLFLVDDHPSVIGGLSAILSAESDLTVLGSASTAANASALFADPRSDVGILDISLGAGDGLAWISTLMSKFPKVKVILYSMHTDQETLRNALQMQVAGYILKTSDPRSVIHAVRSVRSGGTYVDPVLMSQTLARGFGHRLMNAPGYCSQPTVSAREMETLRLTALGYGIKEIAHEFKLSPKSIETYKLRATDKLGLKSRSAIVRYAIANGWFSTLD